MKIKEIDDSFYNFKNKDEYEYKIDKGLNEKIVRDISKRKEEPDWLLEKRLEALKVYNELPLPSWGPDLSMLDINNISTYVKPKGNKASTWDDVPKDIKETFDRLGIPESEHAYLAGVEAQYDSEVVYHAIKEELKLQGVIYTDFDTAVKEYPDLIKEYFSTVVPITDHKFIALHYAVFSGGSFVYVPKNTEVYMPVQAYYRLNSPESGQFEHTLIIVDENSSLHFIEGCSAPKYSKVNLHAGCVELYVKKGAYLRYSTIENWSKNMMNLNTKRCICENNARIEWISGSFGSHTSMLYPMSVLNGENAISEFTGISFAGKNQNIDNGFKCVLNAPNTKAVINTKSISKAGGVCTYRSFIKATKNAVNGSASTSCDSLMLDDLSRSDTIPVSDITGEAFTYSHEAKIGKINSKALFYLMSRGISEKDATSLIVRGFAFPISKELPMEYAVEMNNLINLELEGGL